MAGVTVGSRNTCYRAARCGLTRTGLAPVGLHQLLLAPSEVFGEAGKHARSAVGMAGLPGNSPIEVEMIVEFE